MEHSSAASASRLSDEIARLTANLGKGRVRFREVLEITHGRGYSLLLFLLALPFCTPVPMVGFSTPFGLVIALFGVRLLCGEKPWVPERLLNSELPQGFFLKVMKGAQRVIRVLESILRPRLLFLSEKKILRRLYGLIIFCSGVLLLLPLPIPFSNFFPAFTVVLLSGALLERDGVCVVAGLSFFLATLGFFSAVVWGGTEVFQLILARIPAGF